MLIVNKGEVSEMGKRIYQLINRILMSLMLALSMASFAQTNDDVISAYTLEQVPYGFKNDSGEVTGFLYEMMTEIITTSELTIAHQILPPKRLFKELNNQKQSCSILAGTSFIKNQFDLIEPIGVQLSAGILPKAGIKLTDYDSLKNISIAVPLGIHFNERFDNDDSLDKMFPAKYLNAIQMMKHEHVDAAAGAIASLLYIAKQEGMSENDFDKPLNLAGAEIYLTCSRATTKDIRHRLGESVKTLKRAGRFQTIINHYLALDK